MKTFSQDDSLASSRSTSPVLPPPPPTSISLREDELFVSKSIEDSVLDEIDIDIPIFAAILAARRTRSISVKKTLPTARNKGQTLYYTSTGIGGGEESSNTSSLTLRNQKEKLTKKHDKGIQVSVVSSLYSTKVHGEPVNVKKAADRISMEVAETLVRVRQNHFETSRYIVGKISTLSKRLGGIVLRRKQLFRTLCKGFTKRAYVIQRDRLWWDRRAMTEYRSFVRNENKKKRLHEKATRDRVRTKRHLELEKTLAIQYAARAALASAATCTKVVIELSKYLFLKGNYDSAETALPASEASPKSANEVDKYLSMNKGDENISDSEIDKSVDSMPPEQTIVSLKDIKKRHMLNLNVNTNESDTETILASSKVIDERSILFRDVKAELEHLLTDLVSGNEYVSTLSVTKEEEVNGCLLSDSAPHTPKQRTPDRLPTPQKHIKYIHRAEKEMRKKNVLQLSRKEIELLRYLLNNIKDSEEIEIDISKLLGKEREGDNDQWVRKQDRHKTFKEENNDKCIKKKEEVDENFKNDKYVQEENDNLKVPNLSQNEWLEKTKLLVELQQFKDRSALSSHNEIIFPAEHVWYEKITKILDGLFLGPQQILTSETGLYWLRRNGIQSILCVLSRRSETKKRIRINEKIINYCENFSQTQNFSPVKIAILDIEEADFMVNETGVLPRSSLPVIATEIVAFIADCRRNNDDVIYICSDDSSLNRAIVVLSTYLMASLDLSVEKALRYIQCNTQNLEISKCGKRALQNLEKNKYIMEKLKHTLFKYLNPKRKEQDLKSIGKSVANI
eukprot:g1079.t1